MNKYTNLNILRSKNSSILTVPKLFLKDINSKCELDKRAKSKFKNTIMKIKSSAKYKLKLTKPLVKDMV
jgi:hypothetical protein